MLGCLRLRLTEILQRFYSYPCQRWETSGGGVGPSQEFETHLRIGEKKFIPNTAKIVKVDLRGVVQLLQEIQSLVR